MITKNKIKIGMVQVNNSFSGQNYLPLSIGFLVSYAKQYAANFNDYEFLSPIYKRVPIEEAVELYKDADIVAFSVYVWNNNISMRIAEALKKVNPNILILVGGCHIPERPEYIDKFMNDNPYVDLASVGEGEHVFSIFLENYPEKTWNKVPSMIYRGKDGKPITVPQAERIKDMNEIPSPFLEGYFDSLIEQNPHESWIGLWETNRGCPFSCTYCDWGVGFKKKVQKYNLEDRLFLEVDWFSKNKIEFIFCCDGNFGIYKDRDYAIAERFANNKKKYGYPHALSVQNTKNKSESSYRIQKLLATSGLSKGVLIAFESVHEPTLKAIKRHNIKLSHFYELQKRFAQDGIKTFSDLILGLPEETCESFISGIISLIEMGQHNRIQFNNLSILPNTEMADPEYLEKYGIDVVESEIINIHGTLETEDVPETQQMVIGTKSMNGDDWVRARYFGYMVGFLYFNKIFQIPLTIANSVFNVDYSALFDAFMEFNQDSSSALSKLQQKLFQHAKDMQTGGPEFSPSKKWLNIYWPPDELAFIEVITSNEMEEFYEDAKAVLYEALQKSGAKNYEDVITQSVELNKILIKLPNQTEDLEITLKYNIWDVYNATLMGKQQPLEIDNFKYFVDRTSEIWNSWEDWCRKVVWWCNKKGAYLYDCIPENIDTNDTERREGIKSEPFGNDARYQ